VPRDLPDFEIHWADASDDLFEVSLTTTYLDVRVYTKDAWTAVPAWQRLADQREPVTMQVTGMAEASPTTACKSSTQRAYVADQGFVGGVYWLGTYGMMRYSVAAGTASSLFPPTTVNVSVGAHAPTCTGCALSSDGARMALAGAIYDFTTDTGWTPSDGTNPRSWTAATFDPIGAKLVITHDDVLELITLDGTSLAMPPSSGVARDPQLSADGTMLANVESFTTGDAIVVRTFDNATNEFGETQTVGLVETGVEYHAPAWSPDGQWLAYTRTSGSISSIWVVKVDGSQSPIQVTLPGADTAARARWAPVHHTFGPSRFFYLAFDSTQTFGQRLTGTRQLWALPFFPDANTIGPAFHLPMQWLVENQLIEWTTGVAD
jgi:hypothetical protein